VGERKQLAMTVGKVRSMTANIEEEGKELSSEEGEKELYLTIRGGLGTQRENLSSDEKGESRRFGKGVICRRFGHK